MKNNSNTVEAIIYNIYYSSSLDHQYKIIRYKVRRQDKNNKKSRTAWQSQYTTKISIQIFCSSPWAVCSTLFITFLLFLISQQPIAPQNNELFYQKTDTMQDILVYSCPKQPRVSLRNRSRHQHKENTKKRAGKVVFFLPFSSLRGGFCAVRNYIE